VLHVLQITTMRIQLLYNFNFFTTHYGRWWTTCCRWLWCQLRRPELKCHLQPCSSKCGCTAGSTNFGKHKCHFEARNCQNSRIFWQKGEGHCHCAGVHFKNRWMLSFQRLEWHNDFCQFSTLSLWWSRRMAFTYSPASQTNGSSENLDKDKTTL